MIDKNKLYTTRSGLPVRIYATDCGGYCPVHGAMLIGGVWKVSCWTSSGRYYPGSGIDSRDLIEVKPRIQRTEWFNIYRDRIECGHKTRAEADAAAGIGRKACLEITIDCKEGDGL